MHPDDSNIVDVIEKNAPGTSNRQLREIALKWNSIRKKSEEVKKKYSFRGNSKKVLFEQSKTFTWF